MSTKTTIKGKITTRVSDHVVHECNILGDTHCVYNAYDEKYRKRVRGVVFTKMGIVSVYVTADGPNESFNYCHVAFINDGRIHQLARYGKITELGAARVAKRFARDVVAGKIVATVR